MVHLPKEFTGRRSIRSLSQLEEAVNWVASFFALRIVGLDYSAHEEP